MSETSERAATVESSLRTEQSAAKNLFFGEILEENLFPYPTMRERDRELLGMMTDSIDDFLAPQHADLKKWDKEAHQPAEFIQSLRDMGLFGLIIPEEHGGLGLSNAAYARVPAVWLATRRWPIHWTIAFSASRSAITPTPMTMITTPSRRSTGRVSNSPCITGR